MNLQPLYLLQPGDPKQSRVPGPRTDEDTDRAGAPWILCQACGHPLTRPNWRVDRHGSHAHTFFNPHGLMFEILCFSKAPGCLGVGEPSTEFTWFSGHAWQIAVCQGCMEHLGWRFAGEAASFWGLIRNRLAEPE